VVLWIAGCPFRCTGCIEEHLQSKGKGEPIDPDTLFEHLQAHLEACDGLTLTGGEPLYHPIPLNHFLSRIKEKGTHVMLFTGYSTEEFECHFKELHPLVDLCVTEPFDIKTHGNHLWRGSSNQLLSSPSGYHTTQILEKWMQTPGNGIHLHIDDTGDAFIYGIPAPGQNEKIEKLLLSKGIHIYENYLSTKVLNYDNKSV